jgi:hypothetical protein
MGPQAAKLKNYGSLLEQKELMDSWGTCLYGVAFGYNLRWLIFMVSLRL